MFQQRSSLFPSLQRGFRYISLCCEFIKVKITIHVRQIALPVCMYVCVCVLPARVCVCVCVCMLSVCARVCCV